MPDRIHAALDGDLPRSALAPAEAARADALEQAAARAARALRSLPAPDLSARVMAAVRAAEAPPREAPWTAAWRWIWQPRELRLRLSPALGGGMLALAAVLLFWLAPARGGPHPPAVAAAPAAPVVFVQFRLQAPSASAVRLAGSFTGWKPSYSLRETTPGVWTAVVPMRPGVHDYLFVVDGREWVPDPGAVRVADGLGGVNSRVLVPSPLPAT